MGPVRVWRAARPIARACVDWHACTMALGGQMERTMGDRLRVRALERLSTTCELPHIGSDAWMTDVRRLWVLDGRRARTFADMGLVHGPIRAF